MTARDKAGQVPQAEERPAAGSAAGRSPEPGPGVPPAGQWHEAFRHLVQAHGAGAGRLAAYTPDLGQLLFAHFDTHAALTLAGLRPPDGHAHPGSLPPGWPETRPGSFRPFPPSRTAAGDVFFTDLRRWPQESYTGLPHTGETPDTPADLDSWPATALARARSRAEWLGRSTPDQETAARRGYIRAAAGRAARRHRRVSPPGPAGFLPAAGLTREGNPCDGNR